MAGGQLRIDELRQEGRKERDGLRIGHRHQKAAGNVDAMTWRGDLPLFAGMAPRLYTEPDKIGCTAPAKDFKNFRRSSQNPVQAKCNAGNQHRVAERGAQYRHQGRADAARGPGRDDERDDRARDNDENECYEQERREELVVHGLPELSFRGTSVASEPGNQTQTQCTYVDSGSALSARPGMTKD